MIEAQVFILGLLFLRGDNFVAMSLSEPNFYERVLLYVFYKNLRQLLTSVPDALFLNLSQV